MLFGQKTSLNQINFMKLTLTCQLNKRTWIWMQKPGLTSRLTQSMTQPSGSKEIWMISWKKSTEITMKLIPKRLKKMMKDWSKLLKCNLELGTMSLRWWMNLINGTSMFSNIMIQCKKFPYFILEWNFSNSTAYLRSFRFLITILRIC